MYFEEYQMNKQKYLALQESMQTGGVDWSKNGLPNYNNHNNNNKINHNRINNNINHHNYNNNYYNYNNYYYYNYNKTIDINLNLMSGYEFTISVLRNISICEFHSYIINHLINNKRLPLDSTIILVNNGELLNIDGDLLFNKIYLERYIELTVIIQQKNN